MSIYKRYFLLKNMLISYYCLHKDTIKALYAEDKKQLGRYDSGHNIKNPRGMAVPRGRTDCRNLLRICGLLHSIGQGYMLPPTEPSHVSTLPECFSSG